MKLKLNIKLNIKLVGYRYTHLLHTTCQRHLLICHQHLPHVTLTTLHLEQGGITEGGTTEEKNFDF